MADQDYECNYAALCGDIPTLQTMIDNGFPLDHMVLRSAVEGGDPNHCAFIERDVPNNNEATIKFLLDHDVVKHYAACAAAPNVKVLKLLHENDVPLNNFVCTSHVDNNRLECLVYAIENGCPFILEDISNKALALPDGKRKIFNWICANTDWLAQLESEFT